MELTPVRVRGKRGQGRSTFSAYKYGPTPTGICPLLAAANEQAAKTSASAKRTRSQLSRPSKRRKKESSKSSLERLPTELLEAIFFYTGELALPRASPTLGAKLGHFVQLNFSLRVLYNPKYWFDAEVPELATQLLACRFFDWEFFTELSQKAFSMRQKLLTSTSPETESWFEKGSCFTKEDLRKHMIVPERLRQGANNQLWPNFFRSRSTPMSYVYDPIISPDDPKRCTIPEKLLHGPWTEEKATFLEVLMKCNAIIDYEYSTAGEVVQEGLNEAVRSGNWGASMALISTMPTRLVTTDLVRSIVDETACFRKGLLGVMLNTRSGRHGRLQKLTPEEKKMSPFDAHDPYLWSWADRAEERGDDTGTFLKEQLRRWLR